MPIAIECPECHSAFKVDDKLAGKKVKCRECGRHIAVPGGLASMERECLSCGAPLAEGAQVCRICGFDEVTGRKDGTLMPQLGQAPVVRRRKWTRKSDSALLEMIDGVIKGLVLLGLLGGIAFAVVRMNRIPAGFSILGVVPMATVVGLMAIIMAPLATLAVNKTLLAMKIPPRDDTYTRMLAVFCLPFATGLYAGWPEMAADWGWAPKLSWLFAVLLLLYFLRGELVEWGASVLAAVIALVFGLLLANLAVMPLAGQLYADMLPEGLWQGLASGHSPEPAPLAPRLAAGTMVAPTERAPSRAPAGPFESQPVVPTPTESVTAARGDGGIPRPRAVMESAFFAGVIDERDLREAAEIVMPTGSSDWLLAVKSSGTTTEVNRWSVNPLEKKEGLSYLYYAKMPAQFAISGKGDVGAALEFFPRRQMEVVAFDGKTRSVIALDVPANIPEGASQGVPELLAVLDSTHLLLRWDMNGNGVLQRWNGGTGRGLSPTTVPLGAVAAQHDAVQVSPNGRLVAAFGRNQISFASLDTGPKPAPLIVASDTNVRLFGQAFSPDSSQIAVYAAIADLPTIRIFQVKGGDSVNGLLSQNAVESDFKPMPHALLWLPGSQSLLLNGNDLVDPETGKKFAKLGLEGVIDQQVIGGNLVAFTFQGEGGPRTILAKLDEGAIRAAKGR